MADVPADLAGAHDGVRVGLTQREFGNIVGMTRESVNKCLRDWQRSGIVRIDGNEIVIVKRDALEDVAQTG
jgi:CRP/FNR family cyclic AMP-dependent transcriptional regulator